MEDNATLPGSWLGDAKTSANNNDSWMPYKLVHARRRIYYQGPPKNNGTVLVHATRSQSVILDVISKDEVHHA